MTKQGPAELAVVLHDLAWLLPRTIGAAAMRAEPQPPTALEVMRLLSRRPGLSVNEVSRELGVAANNISTTVGQLADQGLLDKRTDPTDGRVTRLYLTAVARQARRRRERSWGIAMESALSCLEPDEARALLACAPVLRRLSDHLADDDRMDT